MSSSSEPPLKFPRRVIQQDKQGRPTSEEYDIPINAKKAVLKRLYPFDDCPDLSDQLFDLHEGKKFTVSEFKVVREDDKNYLVSPFYYKSGGTVIDWMPANFDEA